MRCVIKTKNEDLYIRDTFIVYNKKEGFVKQLIYTDLVSEAVVFDNLSEANSFIDQFNIRNTYRDWETVLPTPTWPTVGSVK